MFQVDFVHPFSDRDMVASRTARAMQQGWIITVHENNGWVNKSFGDMRLPEDCVVTGERAAAVGAMKVRPRPAYSCLVRAFSLFNVFRSSIQVISSWISIASNRFIVVLVKAKPGEIHNLMLQLSSAS